MDKEIPMKIEFPVKGIFDLEVNPQITLGQVAQSLINQQNLKNIPPVDQITYTDHWGTHYSFNKKVKDIKPYNECFQVSIKLQKSSISTVLNNIIHKRNNKIKDMLKQGIIDDQIFEMVNSLIQKLSESEKKNQELQAANKKLTQLKEKNTVMEKKISSLQKQLKQKSESYKSSNQKLRLQIQDLKTAHQNAIAKFQLQKSIKSTKDPFFQSSILYENGLDQSISDFLLKSIGQFENKAVNKLKLLYQLDVKNLANFHNYLNNKNNLLILIHTLNKKQFGAFLKEGLSQKNDKGKAFLFSIDQKMVFHKTNQTDISHINDLLRIVIGNCDIVINTRKNIVDISAQLFSKISSFTHTGSLKYDIFTGSLDKFSVQVQSYEIYQVIFDNK